MDWRIIKTKIFHKYVIFSFALFLLISGLWEIHSILGTENISDWNFHELQKINKNKTNFSFAVFGDNKNSITTFNNLISKLNKENIAFAIDDGDLVYEGSKEEFRFFLNQIKKLNKPLITVFGNHEAMKSGRTNYYNLFGPFYYSFSIGESYFIILDDANEKNLDVAQFSWLKNQLKISQNYKYRFVFMHVPLCDPRGGYCKKGFSLRDFNFAKKLNNLFAENNITMLFVSHIHGYYKGKWEKTPYILTGGGGAELVGSNPKHYFYHYIKVKVSDSKVKYSLIKLRSPKPEIINVILHDIWIYIYAFFAIHFIDMVFFISFLYFVAYIMFVSKELFLRKR